MSLRKNTVLCAIVAVALIVSLWPAAALAHNVSKRDAGFVQSTHGRAIGPFLYLGAKLHGDPATIICCFWWA